MKHYANDCKKVLAIVCNVGNTGTINIKTNLFGGETK